MHRIEQFRPPPTPPPTHTACCVAPVDFAIVSHNTRTTFSGLRNRNFNITSKYASLRRLLQKHDITCLQETHGQADLTDAIRHNFPDHTFITNFGPDEVTGGTAIAIRSTFLHYFTHYTHHIMAEGRIHVVTLHHPVYALTVANIHLAPSWLLHETKAHLRRLRTYLDTLTYHHKIITGDFNFSVTGEGIYHVASDTVTYDSTGMCAFFHSLFSDHTDLHSHNPTRRELTADGKLEATSRIDRLYTNLPPPVLFDLKPCCNTLWHIFQHTNVSDHLPLHCHFPRAPPTASTTTAHPLWVYKHPSYPRHLERLIKEMPEWDTGDLTARFRHIHLAFDLAAQEVKRSTRHREATTIDERIAVCLTAYRTAARQDTRTIDICLHRCPALKPFFHHHQLEYPQALHQLTASLVRTTYEERQQQQQEFLATLDEEDERRVKQPNSNFGEWAQRFSLKGHRVGLRNLCGLDGSPLPDPQDQATAFIAHWQPRFQEKPIHRAALRHFRTHVQRLPDHMREYQDYMPTFAMFVDHIRQLKDTAPGPDGIPYAAWRYAPEEVLHQLYFIITEILEGEPLPEKFNHAIFALLPKGLDGVIGRWVDRAPNKVRTLSLSNTEKKLVSGALYPALQEVANTVCLEYQTGMKSRVMLDNVLLIDTYARATTHFCLHHPAILTCDFAAASPSLAWHYLRWIWRVMELPLEVRFFLQSLYQDVYHQVRLHGRLYEGFPITTGIVQGDPLSSVIFVIALDPFLRLVVTRIPRSPRHPCTTHVGYMDDLAFTLSEVEVELPVLLRLYALFEQVSHLCLNLDKCVFVPLWVTSLAEAQDWLYTHVAAARGFQVSGTAKLPGIWIGPQTHGRNWDDPMNKLEHRVHLIHTWDLGLSATVERYNSLAFSCLQHVAQLSHPPPEILRRESRVHQLLPRAPCNAFTTGFLGSLKDLGLRASMDTLASTHPAAKYRYAHLTSKVYHELVTYVEQLHQWRQPVWETVCLLRP